MLAGRCPIGMTDHGSQSEYVRTGVHREVNRGKVTPTAWTAIDTDPAMCYVTQCVRTARTHHGDSGLRTGWLRRATAELAGVNGARDVANNLWQNHTSRERGSRRCSWTAHHPVLVQARAVTPA
jgi:hypothetical protein